jgi:F-type H+-transporting ATPase subunit b
MKPSNKLLVLMALLLSLVVVVTPSLAFAESKGGGDTEESKAHEETKQNPLSIDPDLAIFTAIVFVILLLVLRKFAWGPIVEGLEKRESSIANQIEEAKQCNEKAKQSLAEYEAKLAASAEEVKAMLAEARQDAEATKARIVSEAEEVARRERDRAVQDIGLAKEAAIRELAQRSVDSAVSLASQVLRKEVDSGAHSQLIQESLEKFPSRN